MESLSSSLYSLEILQRHFESPATTRQEQNAVISLLQPRWKSVLKWCSIFSSELLSTLPINEAQILMALLAHFFYSCISHHPPLLEIPESVDLCVDLWAAVDKRGHFFCSDDPCPLFQAMEICIKGTRTSETLFKCLQWHPHQAQIGRHMVAQLKIFLSTLLQTPLALVEFSTLRERAAALISTGMKLIQANAHEVSLAMTYHQFFHHLFVLLNWLTDFSTWRLGVVPQDEETTRISTFALQSGVDTIRFIMGFIMCSRRHIRHIEQAVSGGALNVLLAPFGPRSIIDRHGDITTLALDMARDILCHRMYPSISRALKNEFKMLPESYYRPLMQHSGEGKSLFTQWHQLEHPGECQPRSAVAMCSNLAVSITNYSPATALNHLPVVVRPARQ